MYYLLTICTSLCVAAHPTAGKTEGSPPSATEIPRFETASLPEGALARFGGDRLTLLQPHMQSLESIEFAEDGKVLQGWDGQTLYRWEFPSGRPLERLSLPSAVNPPGRPFVCSALSPHHAQLAWIRFHDDKERLQVWDFLQRKLVLDCDVTVEDKALDYADLAWSEDGAKLLAVLSNQQVHVYDLQGTLVEKTLVVDGNGGLELPSGKKLRRGGRIKEGLIVGEGKASLRIALNVESRVIKAKAPTQVDHRGPDAGRSRLVQVLTFTELHSKKTTSIDVVPELVGPGLVSPGLATSSKGGRYLALVDDSRVRIWDIGTHQELEFTQALPLMGQLVISPGGTYVQFQRDRLTRLHEDPWHSLYSENGRLRRLETPSPSEEITLGLGPTGFAAGPDEFIGITGRALDRWDLKTGRRLDGTRLPDPPQMKGFGVGYDECLLLGDGFRLIQFACLVTKAGPERAYKSTWRVWSPAQEAAELRLIPDCTWQRGAAALPQGRFLYFATPSDKPEAKNKQVRGGVTLVLRGEMQMFFGRLDRPDACYVPAFRGTWSELRGVSRGGHLLLLNESSNSWMQLSRHSQGTWADPAAQRHTLLEYHSGEPVGNSAALAKIASDRSSHLSADGRFVLIAGHNSLLLYEPFVLGKVVKEFPLPATPKRFAVSKDGGHMACQLDDATLMIWDGKRLARFVDEALTREVPKDLNTLVSELASSPTSAYRAVRLLALAGDSGVAALRGGMDGKTPDAAQIAGWIHDLDSNVFATREQAESSLASWSTHVEKPLREAMNANPSAEKRVRIQRLLTQLVRSPYGTRERAQARAVLALEWNGSPSALSLLKEWADQYPHSILGRESKFVLANRAR